MELLDGFFGLEEAIAPVALQEPCGFGGAAGLLLGHGLPDDGDEGLGLGVEGAQRDLPLLDRVQLRERADHLLEVGEVAVEGRGDLLAALRGGSADVAVGPHPQVVELGEGLGALVEARQVLLVGCGEQALHALDGEDRARPEPRDQSNHDQESRQDADAKGKAHGFSF
ncbi:hypothetical protein D3C86_1427310 [compost metagenome]